MSSQEIDLRSAADRLGVHYQTAYKWVRSGELRAGLVQGKYRVALAEVDRVRHKRSRPTRTRARRPRAGFEIIAARFFDLVTSGEERQARTLVNDLVTDGVSLTSVGQQVLVPTLRRVGEEWQAGRLGISIEHRASGIIDRILGEQHPMPRGHRRGVVVVASLSGDRHGLATTLAAVALRDDNWTVHHLGADVPPEDLVSFCRETEADLATLTVTTLELRETVQNTADKLTACGHRALVGAPGQTLEHLQTAARAGR